MSTVYDEKLLDKVGLAMVPSGYTNNAADEGNVGGALGKVYSVLPAQTEIDVLNIQSVPAWTSWDGSVITTDGNGDTGYINLVQQYEAQAGKTYKLTLTAELNNTVVAIYATGNVGVSIQEGTNTYTFVHDGASNMLIRLRVVTDAGITLSNISLVQVSNGDFDFSRGSDATRVNSQGYIESVQVLSDELVQNGDFEETGSELVQNGDFEEIGSELITNVGFDNANDYTVDPGWTIANGVATYDGLAINQDVQFNGDFSEANKVYRISFEVISDDDMNLFFGAGASPIVDYTIYSKGTHVVYGKSPGGGSQFKMYATNINGGNAGVVDNVSIKEVGQNWTFGDSWNMGDGVAVSDGSSSNSNFTYQNILTLGRAYKVTLDAVVNSGTLNVYAATTVSGAITSSGTYTFYDVNDRTDNDLHLKAVNFNGSIDNVSVVEVGQNWIFGTGWSLGSDGGNLKAVANGTNAFLEQASTIQPIQPNTSYRVKFSLSDYVTGVLRVALGGYSAGLPAYKNGDYTIDLISNSSSNTRIYFYAQGTCDFAIDNISIKEVTEDTDIPRLDYTNSACPSLLLEPERTNLFTHSEHLDVFPWNSYVAAFIDSSVTTSPEGFLNASLLKEDTTNNSHFVYKDFNLTNGSTYTISIFAKSSGKNRNLRFGDGGVGWSSGWGSANFDLTNGTSDIGTIENYGNGWYRCSVTGTTNATSSRLIIYSILNNTTTYQGDGLSGVYIWGMQVEEGSYPTSYIPTNGLLVTRRVDLCNNAGDSTIFNDSEGVLYAEIKPLSLDYIPIGGNDGAFSIGDSQNHYIKFWFQPWYGDRTLWWGYKNDSTTFNISLNLGPLNLDAEQEYFKIAYKYKPNDFSLWVNGKKVDSQNTYGTFDDGDLKSLAMSNGLTGKCYGNVRQVLYFNEALSDAELEYITSDDIDLTIHNYKGSLSKISATYEDVGVKDRLTKLF